MQPDNFFYFLFLFTIAIFGGTYLLFAYYRNTLLLFNALMFYLCGMRASTEYYLPSVEQFSTASNLAVFHSLVLLVLGFFEWYCIWFYVRPFKDYKFEKIANQFYLWIILIIPVSFKLWWLFQRKIFAFYPEKIDGYWMFSAQLDFEYIQFYFIHADLMGYITIAVLAISIYKNPKHRFRQSLLLLSFAILPYIYFNFFEAQLAGQYRIPNVAWIALAHTLIISWFISDYRMFQNTFSSTMKDILDSVADLTIYTDMKYQIEFVNTATKELFTDLEVKGDIIHLLNKYNASTSSDLKSQIEQLATKKTTEQELQLQINDVPHYLRLQSKPFYHVQQQIGYIFIMANQTELRYNQSLLEQSNQTKDQLFAIIGHDLRRPGIAFRGISKKINYLIQRKDYMKLQKLGDTWETAAKSLNHLIANLLSWALQQRGVMPHDPQQLSLMEVIDTSLEFLKDNLIEKNIQLVIELPTTVEFIADFNSMTTVVRNIIDNAIKFTPELGIITISAAILPQQIIISIKDTGIGMSEEQLSHFTTLTHNKSRFGTKGEVGTGLGLNLVRELLTLNNSRMEVESKPNQGTTVHLTLPRVIASI